ncbi:MAG TPA: pro-sigmaK processing inhibitor BofA family protein [Candidatus Acidoferrum sp.]|nr:pro-sigmaK processing inhibitor BofA family protein [Candidatus Acidoferrum sp.]
MNLTGTLLLIAAVIVGVVLLSRPLQAVLKAVLRGVLGVLGLFALSVVGTQVGLVVGVNAVTVLTAALLGLPGITALALMRLVL